MTLHGALQERGLEVLAFPCNQFGYQEPKGAEDVEACVRARYGVGFTIMEKVHVNGRETHPVYRWLRLGATEGDEVDRAPYLGWNFIMFVVGRDGKNVLRLPHNQSPASARAAIEDLLAAPAPPTAAAAAAATKA